MRHVILWLVTHGSILCFFFFCFSFSFFIFALFSLRYMLPTREETPVLPHKITRGTHVHEIDHGVLPYYRPSAIS